MDNGTYKLEDGRVAICINNIFQIYSKENYDLVCSATRNKLFGRLAKQSKQNLLKILDPNGQTASFTKLTTGKLADLILWIPKQTCNLLWLNTSQDPNALELRKNMKNLTKV